MFKLPWLRHSEMSTECDACGLRFDLMTGGTCEECRRILCKTHLHGTWLRRMRHEFGGPVRCVRCASGAPAAERERGVAAGRH